MSKWWLWVLFSCSCFFLMTSACAGYVCTGTCLFVKHFLYILDFVCILRTKRKTFSWADLMTSLTLLETVTFIKHCHALYKIQAQHAFGMCFLKWQLWDWIVFVYNTGLSSPPANADLALGRQLRLSRSFQTAQSLNEGKITILPVKDGIFRPNLVGDVWNYSEKAAS